MIQRMSEEWERIGDSFRRRETMEVEELTEVLRAVHGVRDAIREVARVSVTRANFRSAVREAVEALFKEGTISTLPGKASALPPEGDAAPVVALDPHSVSGGWLTRLEAFEARVAALAASRDDLLATLSGVDGKVVAIDRRVEELSTHVAELRDRLGSAAEKPIQALDARILQVEEALQGNTQHSESLAARLRGVESELGEAHFRVTEADARGSQAHVAIAELRGVLEADVRALIADIHATHRAQTAEAEVQTARWRALQSQVAGGLEAVESTVQGVRTEALQLLSRLEGSVPGVVRGHVGDLEARLRRDLESTAKNLAGLISRIEAAWPEALSLRSQEMEDRWRDQLESSSRGLLGSLSLLEQSFSSLLASRTTEVAAGLRQELQGAVGGLSTQCTDLRATLLRFTAELEERFRADLSQSREQGEVRLRQGLTSLEARIGEVRGELGRLLSDLAASVPAIAGDKAAESEARLRKEIDAMLARVAEQLTQLRELLTSVGEGMSRREAVEDVRDRLARVERSLDGVSGRVESLDSLPRELAAIGGRFEEVRASIGDLGQRLGASGTAVGALHEALVQGHGELQALVRGGIQRWENDQSHMLERLGAIRDTLRDQLRSLGDRVEVAQHGGLLAKLTGRREGSVKLSRDEWDHVSTKLEGIISGLESILAKKQRNP
jgi:DNA repair exonuclease SbcCD ATPase subunit